MSEETDGSLFWKLSEGRPPMPSWKDDLTKMEHWQLVDHVRTLVKNATERIAPLRISGSRRQGSVFILPQDDQSNIQI